MAMELGDGAGDRHGSLRAFLCRGTCSFPSPSIFPCLRRLLLHGQVLPCRCPQAGRVFLGCGSCWHHVSTPSTLTAGPGKLGPSPGCPRLQTPGSPGAWEKPVSTVLLSAASSLTSGPLKMPLSRAGQVPQRGSGCLQPLCLQARLEQELIPVHPLQESPLSPLRLSSRMAWLALPPAFA